MNLATDIRKLLTEKIASASSSDVLAIASALCANDIRVPAPAESSRYTKFDGKGCSLPASASDWVAVYDAETNLTWTRKPLDCGTVPWKDAKKAVDKHRLFDKADWRLPTVKELVSLIDYDKFPAVDAQYFSVDTDYTWSGTPDAEDPSDYAWVVDLHYGNVARGGQTGRGSVRAVRAGQPLELFASMDGGTTKC